MNRTGENQTLKKMKERFERVMKLRKENVLEAALLITHIRAKQLSTQVICNGNRTEWNPIRSVMIQVITKSGDRAAGVRFVYHEYLGCITPK